MILCAFAGVVGVFTTRQIRNDFESQVSKSADGLARNISLQVNPATGTASYVGPNLATYAAVSDGAKIRLLNTWGRVLKQTPNTPAFAAPQQTNSGAIPPFDSNGYRVETRDLIVSGTIQHAYVQYARPLSQLRESVDKVHLLLVIGVLGGTALALLAGVAVARRAMAPIAALTSSAREIQRTRDPSRRVPVPRVNDEVAELARTLEGMLEALDAAQAETEATLARQREFVADASHELRTPLTSVLANLELLAVELEGEPRDAASSALRSTQRMRRLVADLLLLARADSGRRAASRPTDLAEVVVEAAAELEPVAAGHELSVHAEPAVVDGTRDELHRLVLNLMENAIRHTPEGTHVEASVSDIGGDVVLVVCDDGPGIPPAIRARLFERFVRGTAEGGGGTGLGLSIVRAVAEAHGGGVTVEAARGGGARFVVHLPPSLAVPDEQPPAPAPA